jgi:predicted transcriptional regulator
LNIASDTGWPVIIPWSAPDYAKVRSRLAKKIGLGVGGNPRLAAKRAGKKGR